MSPRVRAALVLATVFVVALYVSVLVHEIAHVLAARAYRMRVASVTLHLLGGETVIEGESRTPAQELVTSIVGPLAVGFTADQVGLRTAFAIPAATCLLAAIGASALREKRSPGACIASRTGGT